MVSRCRVRRRIRYSGACLFPLARNGSSQLAASFTPIIATRRFPDRSQAECQSRGFHKLRKRTAARYQTAASHRPSDWHPKQRDDAVAVDQDAAHAHAAHLAEGDLDRPAVGMRSCTTSRRVRHPASKRDAGQSQIINPLGLGAAATYSASWVWKNQGAAAP